MTNISVRGKSNGEVGWAELCNGMSQVYGLHLYMNNATGRVSLEAINGKGRLTRGGIAVDKAHYLETTIEFLNRLGYAVTRTEVQNGTE